MRGLCYPSRWRPEYHLLVSPVLPSTSVATPPNTYHLKHPCKSTNAEPRQTDVTDRTIRTRTGGGRTQAQAPCDPGPVLRQYPCRPTGPPEYMKTVGEFMHVAEDLMVCKLALEPIEIPQFNAGVPPARTLPHVPLLPWLEPRPLP